MFVTFEGIEGAGKSTAIAALTAWLETRGLRVRRTLEPGGSRLGKTLRAILLDLANTDISSEAELFLYLADRAQHVKEVVRPALDQGLVVISDRYADSTIVYQGYGRGLDVERLASLNEVAVAGLWPDVTFLLDLEPEIGLKRAFARNEQEGKATKEGRFEAEALSFHHRVRDGYLAWAARNEERFRIVPAAVTPEQVAAQVCALMEQTLDARRGR
jgi:dTMP kinase